MILYTHIEAVEVLFLFRIVSCQGVDTGHHTGRWVQRLLIINTDTSSLLKSL